ncbi:amino acid permease [uncultured Ralstonia sp.]|jgi:AAT family amino acid transporter|uniref:amino acid permease n=1 Tax=Ralstonia sp. TaxID=54061 RepID=UPI001EA6976C|nr:amino acid permease [uncultured Ralstonia sp.]UCF24752.1 MAG: amino acid permease [Ralstonia sp.]
MDKATGSFEALAAREGGLQQRLSSAQLTMIAIGSAIGTGLFLGSGAAIQVAGPGVLVSYAIGAVIALLLMGCLAEMVVAHPTTGSFGAYAEHYVSPLAGFLVRYAYWAAVVFVIGAEVTAVAVYMAYWFPGVPAWMWIVGFSAVLVWINASSVDVFGVAEYWCSMIKVVAIVVFLVVASYAIHRAPEGGPIGFHNYVDAGGFLPHGVPGVWYGAVISIFSFFGIELIAVAAGEAREPEAAATRAFRSTLFRLVFFYLCTLALMLAVVPWQEAGTGQSPFVRVMQILGTSSGAGLMNFVVLTAALSSMNAQLYVSTRMLFSLARGGQAPRALGVANRRGVPERALAVSSSGAALAPVMSVVLPGHSFLLMMSLAMFGALFTWLVIFVTHLRFRRAVEREGRTLRFRMWGFPVFTVVGAVAMAAIIVTTAWMPDFRMTLVAGVPFLIVLTGVYRWLRGRQ